MSDKDSRVTVTSYNQSGGVTAHTVNVNAAPEPVVHVQEVFLNQPQGSEYLSRVALTIDSPYPAGNLFIAVSAPSIRKIDLVPQRTGMVTMGNCGNREGLSFANLQQPYGLIHLNVVTSAPETLNIEWNLT